MFYKLLGVIAIVAIPLANYIWTNFLQPAFTNIWNRGKVEEQTGKSPTTTSSDDSEMSCTFSSEFSTATHNGATTGTRDGKKDD